MLASLRKVFLVLMSIVLLFFGVLFSLQNQTVISVDLLLPAAIEQTIAFWLLASFSVGVLLSIVVFSLVFLKHQQKMLKQSIKIRSLQRQLDEDKK